MQDILRKAEELKSGTNPLEGLTKLQWIINRAKTPENITLVCEHVLDLRLSGFLPVPPSVSDFSGARQGAGGKGMVEVILMKWELSRHLLFKWSKSLPFEADVIVQMRKTFASIESYRATVGYPSEKKDLTFRAAWSKPSEEFFTFVEQILYDVCWDAALKDALKNGVSAEDLILSGVPFWLDAAG